MLDGPEVVYGVAVLLGSHRSEVGLFSKGMVTSIVIPVWSDVRGPT